MVAPGAPRGRIECHRPGDRADDAELVPDLEQQCARRLERQEADEAPAQGRFEAVTGDRGAAARRRRRTRQTSRLATRGASPPRSDAASGRATKGRSGAKRRRPAMAAAVSRAPKARAHRRDREDHGARGKAVEGQGMRRDERGERHRRPRAQRFEMAAAGAQPGHRRPEKRTRTIRPRSRFWTIIVAAEPGARPRTAERHGAKAPTRRRRAGCRGLPSASGRAGRDSPLRPEDDGAQDVEEPLGGLGQERRPDQRQGAPDEHQAAGKAPRRTTSRRRPSSRGRWPPSRSAAMTRRTMPSGASTTMPRRAKSAASGTPAIRMAKPSRRSSAAASAAGSAVRGETRAMDQGGQRSG